MQLSKYDFQYHPKKSSVGSKQAKKEHKWAKQCRMPELLLTVENTNCQLPKWCIWHVEIPNLIISISKRIYLLKRHITKKKNSQDHLVKGTGQTKSYRFFNCAPIVWMEQLVGNERFTLHANDRRYSPSLWNPFGGTTACHVQQFRGFPLSA